MNKLFLIIILIVMSIGVVDATWCDTDFAKRINVSVNNTGGGALTNYQVYVNLSSNPINETSLRVYNATSCTLRSHWSENTTGGNSYGIWINYSSIAGSEWTNNTAIYSDNIAVSSVSNGTATFEFFDGFDYTINDHFEDDGRISPIGGVIAYPSSCYYNGTTYTVWQGGGNPVHYYVKAYNHDTDEWSVSTDLGTCSSANEGHGNPAVTMTEDHKILVAYDTHAGFKLKRSTNPENISSFDSPITPCNHANHQKFDTDASNNIHLVTSYCDSHSAERVVTHKQSSDNGSTWSSQQILLDAGTSNKFYTGNIEYDSTNDHLHISWVKCDASSNFNNVYHAYLNLTDNHMYNMSGTDLGVTIDLSEANANCVINNSGSYECYMPALHFDSNDYPYIIYSGSNASANNVYFIRWTGSSWTSPEIIINTTSDDYIYHDFIVHSSTNIEAYLCVAYVGHTWGGGDIEKWHWNGSTWSKNFTILSESDSGKALAMPSIATNFTNDLKLVFYQDVHDYTTHLNGYAYGNSGFVQRSFDSNLDKWTTVESETGDSTNTSTKELVMNKGGTAGYFQLNSSDQGTITAKKRWISKFKLHNTTTILINGDEATPASGAILVTLMESKLALRYYDAGFYNISSNLILNDYYWIHVVPDVATDTFNITAYHENRTELSYDANTNLGFRQTVTYLDEFRATSYDVNHIGTFDNFIIANYALNDPPTTLGSEEGAPESTPVISNVQNGSISSTSQYVDWDVNQTAHNRVLYSNESDLSPAYYSSWDNSTATPNITLSGLEASTQYWYQAWSYNTTNTSLSDNSSTLSFTTSAASLICTYDICVNTSGWWRDGSSLNTTTIPIQDAVDNATSSDIIYVWNGSYTENVDITTASLTLQGEGRDVVTLEGTVANDRVIYINNDYVNILGFNVSNATASPYAGIYINDRDHCNISYNTIHTCYYGINPSQSHYTILNDNIVHNCSDNGIYIWNSNHCTIKNNTIYNCTTAGTNGLWSRLGDNCIIKNNTAYNCFDGIDVRGDNSTISDCISHNNTNYGIVSYDTINNTFTNNSAHHNDDDGFYVHNSTNCSFEITTIYNNTQNGFNIHQTSTNCNFSDNLIYLNGNSGFYLDTSSNSNKIFDNIIHDNTGSGIYLSNVNNNTLTNNTVYNNSHGINCLASNDTICILNTIDDTGAGGYDYYLKQNALRTIIRNQTDMHYNISIIDTSTCIIEYTNNTIFKVNSATKHVEYYNDISNLSLEDAAVYRIDIYNGTLTAGTTFLQNVSITTWAESGYNISVNSTNATEICIFTADVANATDVYGCYVDGIWSEDNQAVAGVVTWTYSDGFSAHDLEIEWGAGGPSDYTPPDPTNLQNTSGDYWVNYTWDVGTPGNVTDLYNVSWNLTWYNDTSVTYMNDSVGASNWANITVWAYNSSGTGTLSSGSVSDEVKVADAPPGDYIPPDPTGLANTTGNFWINHTWNMGTPGNITDSYNVSIGAAWHNTTTVTYHNDSALSAHDWSNVTVLAYNTSGSGTLSAGSVSDDVRIPNNAVILTVTQNYNKLETETVFILDTSSSDTDSDTPTYSCNRTDLFIDFSTVTGYGNWTTGTTDSGVYHVDIGVSDGWGSMDNKTLTITITDATPDTPTNLQNTTGNFWINHTWNGGVNTDSFNVSVNLSWTNSSSNEYFNNTPLPAHSWSNISVYGFNSTSGELSSSVSQNTQIPNNVPVLTGLPDNTTTEDVNQTDIFDLDNYFSDGDGDTPTYLVESNNQSAYVSVTINASNNVSYTLASGWNGTASVVINVTDGYGGEDNDTFLIIVNAAPLPGDYMPGDPTNLQNSTGNYWVNYTWNVGSGNITDSYNVSWNLTWYNTTMDTFMKKEVGASNWANMTVYAYNSSGNGTLSSGNVSDEVQAPSAPQDYTPSDPISLANTTGNGWVNYTWASGGGANITDSYNVSWNLTWYNTTLVTYMNDSVGEFEWANISVYAFNSSGSGTLSTNNVTDETQAGGGTYTTSMTTGVYNLVSYYNSSNSSAEQFGDDISNVDYVARYNNVNNTFTTHVMGMGSNNFTTIHGRGYFIYVNASGSSTYNRNNILDSLYYTNLSTGWDIIGWTNATSTNAEGLINSLGSACKYTSMLNVDGWSYTTHTSGFTINNHVVGKGKGYWVWVNTNTNWNRDS